MIIKLSKAIRDDVNISIRAVLGQSLVLNVFETAEEIRRRHEEQNVALEDIAALVAQTAAQYGCALELSGRRGASAAPQAAMHAASQA